MRISGDGACDFDSDFDDWMSKNKHSAKVVLCEAVRLLCKYTVKSIDSQYYTLVDPFIAEQKLLLAEQTFRTAW